MSATVRPFAAADRAGVRDLAWATADRGRPMEGFPGDASLLSDLLTAYYTDCDPGSAWIAADGGRVVGYVLGCLDPHVYARRMAWSVLPRTLLGAVRRGLWRSAGLWRLALANVGWMASRRLFPPPAPDVRERFPAHLHVNVAAGHRGEGLGPRLLERFLEQARAAGVRGVHASVREDNAAGRAFFVRMGFAPVARVPVMRCPWLGNRMLWSVLHGRAF